VFVRTKDGAIFVRQRVTPHDPRTASQSQARERMARAGHFFRQLTSAEVEAWRQYAEGLQSNAAMNGETKTVRPYNAYVSLASRFLALTPTEEPPRHPGRHTLYRQ
jgi:hypothetical protein